MNGYEFLLKLRVKEIRLIAGTVEGNAQTDPKKIIPTMNEMSPYIRRAIDVIKKAGIDTFVYNMVPCTMPGYENYVNDLYSVSSDTILAGPEFDVKLDNSRRNKKIRTKDCDDCKYNDVCYGVWKNYADVYGLDELRPVK